MSAQFDDYRSDVVTSLRVPPQAVDAEMAVLGGLMQRNSAHGEIGDLLGDGDFYRRDHALIWQAIGELAQKGQPFDSLTLADWFEAQGLADQVAGGAYLIELQSTTASAANIRAYAEIVRDKSQLRQLIALGSKLVDDAFTPAGRDVRELVADAQREVSALAGAPSFGGAKAMREVGRRWFDALQARYESSGALQGLPTPWGRFNAMTSGLKAGELIIVAARPSMGKSAWAVNVATANALSGRRVLFFNLEMTDVSIYNRAVASVMDVPLAWLQAPADGDDHDYWARSAEGVRRMDRSGLLIDDSPGLRREQIIARARREHMRQPVDLVIVDHLHLIPLPGKTRETVEIGHITRDLKALAKELGCPVVLLSQLNRSLETRQNKRPMMADLRESGNIEQDADLIVFLHRDDYYAEKEDRESEYPGFVEIIIGKQREGVTGKVWARDRLAYGLIGDHDGDPPQRPVSQEAATRTRRGLGRSMRDRAAGDE